MPPQQGKRISSRVMMKQGRRHPPGLLHLNKAEGGLQGVGTDRGHGHPGLTEGAMDNVPGQAVHQLSSRGVSRETLRGRDMKIKERRPVDNTVKKVESRTMVNRGPTTEVARREEECNLHLIGEVGVLSGEVITGSMGNQQILGKTLGKGLTKILGKTRGNLESVIIVTTQPGVIRGLVLPRM